MITGIDHIVLTVDDVAAAVATYERLGFEVAGGRVGFGSFCLQFSEPRTDRRGHAGGPPELVFASDDLDADVDRLESAGFATSMRAADVDGVGRRRFRRAADVEFVTPVSLVERRGDRDDRHPDIKGRARHPNTATVLERVYVAVDSMERSLPMFEALVGTRAPEPELGTVIMSLMTVFYLGDIGLAIAEPRGPGPTANALETIGPGLFQVLFRASSLGEARHVIDDNNSPSPELGTRLSGESALLVLPSNACGLAVGLAGPAN